MSDWLYQYWFFSFKTTKHWGKGPLAWTSELLDFTRFNSRPDRSLPGTPHETVHRPRRLEQDHNTPNDDCRWYIHVVQEQYESIGELEIPHETSVQDPLDESTWVPWPESDRQVSLPARLWNALEHNAFNTTGKDVLPVNIPEIAKAAQRSSDEFLLESLGFCIMTRNQEKLVDVLREINLKRIDPSSIHPFHLATSHLDGYRSCCDILRILFTEIETPMLYASFEDEAGHTILDNLMISILKSHSSALPVMVDPSWKDTIRFVGEEVDVCGRWDADSPCVRQLLANGKPSVPLTWKHKFCHTSIQTVCHCISLLSDRMPVRLMLHTASGLFVRRCFDPDCGLKLQLQPLHCLVMTTYLLAQHGVQDEDLFGMLACLLCFVAHNFDPLQRAQISVAALLQADPEDTECNHEDLTAAELAEELSRGLDDTRWTLQAQRCWAVFCGVLRACEDSCTQQSSSDSDESMRGANDHGRDNDLEPHDQLAGSYYIEHDIIHDNGVIPSYQNRQDLGSLWASVQAELLAYRRLDRGRDWISDNFSIIGLRQQLEIGTLLSVNYADAKLLKITAVVASSRELVTSQLCRMSLIRGLRTWIDGTGPHTQSSVLWGIQTIRWVIRTIQWVIRTIQITEIPVGGLRKSVRNQIGSYLKSRASANDFSANEACNLVRLAYEQNQQDEYHIVDVVRAVPPYDHLFSFETFAMATQQMSLILVDIHVKTVCFMSLRLSMIRPLGHPIFWGSHTVRVSFERQ